MDRAARYTLAVIFVLAFAAVLLYMGRKRDAQTVVETVPVMDNTGSGFLTIAHTSPGYFDSLPTIAPALSVGETTPETSYFDCGCSDA